MSDARATQFQNKIRTFWSRFMEINAMRIFHEHDADEDGSLSKKEFNLMLKDDPELGVMMREKGLKAEYYELNGQDSISCTDYLLKMQLNNRLVELFRMIDTNSNGTIEYPEFTAALLRDDALRDVCLLNGINLEIAAFRQIDADNNNVITIDEFMRRMRLAPAEKQISPATKSS